MPQELTTLIAQVGFPMAVAVYLLGRTDKRLDALTKSIRELTDTISQSLRRDQP